MGSAYIWYQPGFGICISFFILNTHCDTQKPRSILTHDYLFISKVPEHRINKHIHFLNQVKFYIVKICVTLMWVPQCGRVSTQNLGEHCSPCAFQIGQIICMIHISDIDFYRVFFLPTNSVVQCIFIYLNRLYNDC